MVAAKAYRVPDGVELIELRTFGDLPPHMTVHIYCRHCGRIAPLNCDLTGEGWIDRPLFDLRSRSRCRSCGKRKATILIHDTARRGSRAWFPHPPLPRN